ncbi:MAG: protein kinase [Deltaproteobacteria bacterium]|nr:protein kinase [Deltaproteobacteria bacterium]
MGGSDVVDDRYRLVALVSETGLSRVYRAIDTWLDREVALKVVHSGDLHAAQRLAREARVLRDLGHPAIVRLLGQGGLTDGRVYLVMEWLEGEDLAKRLRSGPLTIDDAITLAERVLEALDAAHGASIVHRDLKPSNVFLPGGAASSAVLLDFGIAHLTDATVALTAPGMVVGTPSYMSPEQCRGHAIDVRTDLFAVGCLLYECITGVRMFGATSSSATMAKILFETAPRVSATVPTIADELDQLIAQLVAKDPAARPASAADVLATLRGTQAAPTRSRGARGLSAAERRVISVVLATPLPVDPVQDTASTQSLPGTGRSEMESLASQFGARIEPLRNGSFIAVIEGEGSPRDLAFRAARLAMRAAASAPGLRIGIATGATEIVGEQPVGALVESLTDLVERQRAGGVYVDATSGLLLEGRFELAHAGDDRRVIAEYSVEEPRRLLGRRTPFSGRAVELDALEGGFLGCVDDRAARVALVLGEPGAGKTRLVYELAQRISGAELWTAHATPFTSTAPLSVLIGVLRRALGLGERDSAAVVAMRLRQRLAVVMTPIDAARCERVFVEVLSYASVADGETQHAAAPHVDAVKLAWQEWLVAEATAQPLVIILEDLHWCDAPTIAMFEAALPLLADLPVYLIATARPDVRDRFPTLWSRAHVHEIRIEALSPRVSAAFVRASMGPAIEADVVERLVAAAAGNPFFLEELIRHVATGGVDDAMALPPTVVAMAQTRLASLPELARRVLRAASLFGQRFWLAGVEAVLQGDGELGSIRGAIETLIAAEIISARATSAIAGTRELSFGHALLRDAAYDTLTAVDRAAGHRLAARWLAEHGERAPVEIATHFERGDEPLLAVPWYVRAAEQALLAHDLPAVVDLANRGVRAGATGEAALALGLARVEAEQWQGADVARAVTETLRLLEMAAPGSNMWFRAIREAATLCHRRGEIDRLLAWWHLLPSVAPAEGTLDLANQAHAAVAGALLIEGRIAPRDPALQRLLGTSRDLERVGTAWLWATEAIVRTIETDLEAALECERAACVAFEANGLHRHVLIERTNAAFIMIELGDFAHAEVELRKAIHIGQRLSLVDQVASARQNLGLALLALARWDEAEAELRTSIDTCVGASIKRMARLSQVYLARLELERGRPAAALAVTGEVTDDADVVGAYASAIAALAHLALGAPEAALAHAGRAVAQLPPDQQVEGDTWVWRAHVEALLASGRASDGRAAVATAAAQVHARAARIKNPHTRDRYLALPVHHWILTTAGFDDRGRAAR